MEPASLTQKAADSTFTSSSSMMSTISSIAESPKVPLLASKTGINFVIPKNRLSGALVPVVRAGGKSEHNDVKKEEDLKQPSRKTKWGPDLTLDPFVKRGRALALQTRAEQIAAQLEAGNLEIDNDEKTRSPSPPPIYDSSGQRLNTREGQKGEQLDVERREAIGECMRLNPSYKPPSGYKPVYKEAKLFIPVKDHPGYNFIGLILGPRGNTQKRMETETGTKIAIRGRAVKEGKLQATRRDGKELDGGIEDLHVHIAADTWEKIDAAVALIQPLLTPVDEESNPQKQKQLRELAEMNGTLWDHTKACSLCGETGHREWQCAKDNPATFQAKVFCRICGDGGHLTIDCPMKLKAEFFQGKALEEYVSFLEELGSLNPSGQSQASTGVHIAGVLGTETDANGTVVSQPMLLTASGAKPMPTAWTSGTTSSEPAAPGDMYAAMGGGTGVTNFPPFFPPCGLPGRGGLNLFFPPFYHPGLTPLGGVAFFGGRPPFLGNGFHPMMGFIPPNMVPVPRQMHRLPVPVHESALRQHPPVGPDTEHQPKFSSSHELPGKEQGLNVAPSMPAEETIHLRISQPNISENNLPEIASSVHPPDTQSSSLLRPPPSLVTSTDFLPVARFASPPVLYPLPDSEQGCVHVSASNADVFPPFHAASSPGAAQISSNSAFNSVQGGLSVSASPASLNSGPGIFRSSIPVSPLAPPSSSNLMSPTLLVAPPRHPYSIQPRRASLPTSAPPVLSPCTPSSRLLPVPSVIPPPFPVAKSASMTSDPPVPVRPLYPPALPPPFMPSSVSPPFCGPALSSAPPPPQSLVPPSAPPQPRGPPPGPVPSPRSYFDAFSQTIRQGPPPSMFVSKQNGANLLPGRILPPTNIRDPLIPHAHPKWLKPNFLQPSLKDTITPLPPQPSTISQHQLKMERPVLPSAKPLSPGSAPPLPPPRPALASSFTPYTASSGAQTAHVVPPVPLPNAPCSLPFPGTFLANMQSPQAAGSPHPPASRYSSVTVGPRATLPFANPSASSGSPVVVPVITRPPGDIQRTLAGQSTKLPPSFSFLRHPTQSPQWRSTYAQMGVQPESQIRGNPGGLHQLGPLNTISSALPSVRSASEALQRLNRPLVPPVSAVEKGGSEKYDPLLPTVASASIGSVQSEPRLNNSPNIGVPDASIGLSGTIDVPGNRTGSGWLQVAGVTGQVGSELAINSLSASQNSGASQNMVRPPRTEEVDAEYAKLMASVGVT